MIDVHDPTNPTPLGSVAAYPGTTAQHLLEGGPVAVAVAPAGLRTADDAAIESIAAHLEGRLPDRGGA